MRYRFLRFPEGKTKALTVSYDDGCIHDKHLVEILNRYGVKGTFNLNCGFPEESGGWRITAEEVEELILNAGHEVAIHGERHIAPGHLNAIEGIREMLNGRMGLEKQFGRIIRGMAYPDSGMHVLTGGLTKDDIKHYLKELGIVYGRIANGADYIHAEELNGGSFRFALPEDWYEWIPTCHHDNPKLMTYLNTFLNTDVNKAYSSGRYARLFYLWGHSFEFDGKKNWEVIENFCKEASGKEDVWYATNIEIYDYAAAYRALQFSADNTIVYNPTLYTIWFDCEGICYQVAPGETKILN